MKKYVGILKFEALTPIHIGGHRESNFLQILKLPDGRLLIPSTSWKGTIRAIAEKVALSLQMKKIEKLAVEHLLGIRELNSELLGKFKEDFYLEDGENAKDVLMKIGYSEEEINTSSIRKLLEIYLSYYCPIGKLFGNQVWASRVRFLDTILSAETSVRAGVSINRSTGTVRTGSLYFVETILPKTEIPMVMMGEIDSDTSSRILAATLDFVQKLGLSIGARKSVGLGTLVLKQSEFYVVDLHEDENGKFLANPFETKPLDIEEFVKILTS